jgi:hypothetical protein
MTGKSKAASEKETAGLKARKKRIAEVAGSLKTAAAEHKRQKKATTAAAAKTGMANEHLFNDLVYCCPVMPDAAISKILPVSEDPQVPLVSVPSQPLLGCPCGFLLNVSAPCMADQDYKETWYQANC